MKDVHLLKEALPYLRRHRRKTIVVKLGGALAEEKDVLRSLAQDVSLLSHVNIRILVVHGGGPQATKLSRLLGLEPKLVEGRRVTDEATLAVAKMVFGGQINVDILSALRGQGVRAVGLSGIDGNMIQAVRRPPTPMTDEKTGETRMVDFGHVGDITDVDTSLLRLLVENGYVPAISSLGADAEGNILNINADTVASAIAQDLGAERLITLTGVPGVMRDLDDPDSLIPEMSTAGARAAMRTGMIQGGMIPKITALVEAVEGGVGGAVILDGTTKSALLLELFTDRGHGTLIKQGDV